MPGGKNKTCKNLKHKNFLMQKFPDVRYMFILLADTIGSECSLDVVIFKGGKRIGAQAGAYYRHLTIYVDVYMLSSLPLLYIHKY